MSIVDFHNHMIPAVDDGSESLDQSLVALKNMWDQGITHVITTPHFKASTLKQPDAFEAEMGRIDECWGELLQAVAKRLPELRLDRGVELALDDPDPSVTDSRVRLAGTRFVLVEFPNFIIPPDSTRPLLHLRESGVTPIVAHPERYENLDDSLDVLHEWKRSGAFLQLDAGSIVGFYGARAEKLAWRCLESGIVDYLSSDYHARGNCLVAGARQLLLARGGVAQFNALTTANGARMVAGLDPSPVAPLSGSRSRWEWVKAILRLGH
jgi:protein-tyrosine phosphatase